jgi:hypothetical protein
MRWHRPFSRAAFLTAVVSSLLVVPPTEARAFIGCSVPEMQGEDLLCYMDGDEMILWCMLYCQCVGMSAECSWCNDADQCTLDCGCYAS